MEFSYLLTTQPFFKQITETNPKLDHKQIRGCRYMGMLYAQIGESTSRHLRKLGVKHVLKKQNSVISQDATVTDNRRRYLGKERDVKE